MSSRTKQLTLDSVSAGLLTGGVLGWIVNVVDLGFLRPLHLNLWRAVAGLEFLPLNHWALFTREFSAFNRWWFVLVVSISSTLLAASEIRGKPITSRRQARLRMLYSWLFVAVTYELYYIPMSGEAFADWGTRIPLSAAIAALLSFGVFPWVRVATRRFMEVQ